MTRNPSEGDASRASHENRQAAESFGVDAARYDRTRPPYPGALVEQIIADSPGPDILDVGCGTGTVGRQFQAAGCTVLGVEPDLRMAEFARLCGLDVEQAKFEDWDPAGRTFDAVVAGTVWHWVDPAAGSAKAARILRPGGLLAIFGHAFELPSPVHDAFTTAYQQVAPDSPFNLPPPGRTVPVYEAGYAQAADAIRQLDEFADPTQWRIDWERSYTRNEWLDQLPTQGGLTRLSADKLEQILESVGDAIDAMGGQFTMSYATVVVTAKRHGTT